VFVMSDLDIGMNNWMSDPFVYPSRCRLTTRTGISVFQRFFPDHDRGSPGAVRSRRRNRPTLHSAPSERWAAHSPAHRCVAARALTYGPV